MGGTDTDKQPRNELERLVGTWRTEITLPLEPPIVAHGQTTGAWLDDGPFLVVRSAMDNPDFPRTHAILSGDGTTGGYAMLYHDSRGVSRIYEMSLSAQEWKLWRAAPGWHQRFSGTFSADGNTITGGWEKSMDGADWELDFVVVYTKVAHATLGSKEPEV